MNDTITLLTDTYHPSHWHHHTQQYVTSGHSNTSHPDRRHLNNISYLFSKKEKRVGTNCPPSSTAYHFYFLRGELLERAIKQISPPTPDIVNSKQSAFPFTRPDHVIYQQLRYTGEIQARKITDQATSQYTSQDTR